MFIRSVVFVAALVGLTACGGGGGNLSNQIDLSDFPNASYDDLDLAADRLNSYRTTDEATIFSGTATYYGVILMADDLDVREGDIDNASGVSGGVSSEGVIGQVELEANFTAALETGYTVDGTATNFKLTGINTAGNPDGEYRGDLDGTLVLSSEGLSGNFFDLRVISGKVGEDFVLGSFNDNEVDPENDSKIAGFKSPSGTSPTALWVRTSDGSGLTVNSVLNTWDAVIAAD